jgi:hypothetical protein
MEDEAIKYPEEEIIIDDFMADEDLEDIEDDLEELDDDI